MNDFSSRRLIVLSLLTLTFSTCFVAAQTPPAATPSSELEAKAVQLFRQGKAPAALETLRQAVKANPKLPPAQLLLADLYYKSGNGQLARVNLEQSAIEEPQHPELFIMSAQFAMNELRVTDALLGFQAALSASESPRFEPDQRSRYTRAARLGLAAAYQARKDHKSAREQFQLVLADDAKNGPVRQQAAASLFFLNQPEESFKEFQQAFADDPTSDPPELSIAVLWNAKPDAVKAEEWFKKALAAHPENVKVARGYSRWLLDTGRVAEVGPLLILAAKVDGTSRETQSLLGLAARYKADYAAAEKIFETLHRDAPGDAFAAWNLAISLAESGDAVKRQRGVELANATYRQNTRVPEGLAVLSWCLFKAGQIDSAEQAIRAAVNSGPIARDTAYYLSKILKEKGNAAEAKRAVKEALGASGPFVYKNQALEFLTELEKQP